MTGSGVFTISRNAGNGLPEGVAGGALDLARSFNGYGEVARESYRVGARNAGSWDLTRDDTGRITRKTETVDGVASNFDYTYDPMGRLLAVAKDGTVVESYEYGINGARISETNTLRGINGKTFAYSEGDHLFTAGDVAYQYDVDGSLVSRTEGAEVTAYSYSSRGELLNVTLPDGTLIEYMHDPLGRRIGKKVNGVVIEKFLWQGLTRLLAVYDGSDNLLMRFQYADGRMPFSMTKGGSIYYLTYDQVGTLRLVADVYGNVVKRIDYDSFGNVIADTNPAFEVPFGFAGGLYDGDTGLVRFGYRDYDPDVGRWTAKDPILFAGGDTDLYGYCLNDPVDTVDTEGKGPIGFAIGAALILYNGISTANQVASYMDEMAFYIKQKRKLEEKLSNPCTSNSDKDLILDLIDAYKKEGIRISNEMVKARTKGVFEGIIDSGITVLLTLLLPI